MTALRARREERGWTKTQLDVRLRTAARARNEVLPQPQSLARQIARWENGHGAVSELYQQLFCEVYACSPAELGFGEPDAPGRATGDEFALELARASTVDPAVVSLLQDQTDGIRRLDARQGALLIAAQMDAHIVHIDELRRHAVRPGIRQQLAKVQADASTLAGWQTLDIGTPREAWEHFERAKAAALEAEDAALLAFATAEQAYVLLDVGEAEQAAELVAYARDRTAGQVPGLMRTWLSAAQGEMAAAAGQRDVTRSALDEATALLPDEPDAELPFLALNATHLARWRGNCFARLGDTQAIDELTSALAAMDGTYTRAESGLRIDLAGALLVRGEHRTAEEHLGAARLLVNRTGSRRQLRRIEQLRAKAS
ncbi:MAG: hypothetical protein GEV11_15650 [Streptosporangiales bacterium]|nr:hypothetical protein [Streptosporangiales bacterium]